MNIHLVAFNVPFPPNYGGVIDVFYKIKALNVIGIKVHLHCFEYGRTASEALSEICETVYYYKRNTSLSQHFSMLPYIVQSRINRELFHHLNQNDYPILLEGLHCCGLLGHETFKKRLKLVRMHNIEWQYYQHLATKERHFLKRLFFKIETWKLKRFEKIVLHVDHLLTIAPNDTAYFKTHYPKVANTYIPAFHANETINAKIGKGDYALFHGDLSVMDNEMSALYLIDKVFSNLSIPFIIAGLNPSVKLLAKANENIIIKANLTHEAMDDLIENAHVNILFSFHSAGMKLKLLNALFKGRFCIVNTCMIDGTGLENYCQVGDDAETLQQHLNSAFAQSFSIKDQQHRANLLTGTLSNHYNAAKILKILKPLTQNKTTL